MSDSESFMDRAIKRSVHRQSEYLATGDIAKFPYVKVGIGAAAAVIMLQLWYGSVDGISELLGVSGGIASLIIGVGSAICGAVALAAVASYLRRAQ